MSTEMTETPAAAEKPTEMQVLGRWRKYLEIESNRGERAALKRAGSINAVMCQPFYFRLLMQLNALEERTYKPEAVAVIVAVTPFLKRQPSEEDGVAEPRALPSLPTQLGKSGNGDRPVFSELRFQRLMSVREPEELMSQLRRALTQVEGAVDYKHLAEAVLQCFRQWKSPDKYPGSQQWQYRWSSDYYQEISKYQKESK